MDNLAGYIDKAEAELKSLLKAWRSKLMASYGDVEFDFKGDKTVVTLLDGELELAIKDVLRPLNKSVGFMGEEHGLEGPQDIFWTLDPIDGTESFIRGIPSCRSLLSLIVNDDPEYTLVYKFPTDDFYTARRGQGAYKNGQRIKVRYRPLNRAWIEGKPESNTSIMEVTKHVRAVNNTHEFLYVVEGALDGWISHSDKGGLWDYVPRTMLMEEAGLKVANIGSQTYDYKNFAIVAAHPDNFAELSALLSPKP